LPYPAQTSYDPPTVRSFAIVSLHHVRLSTDFFLVLKSYVSSCSLDVQVSSPTIPQGQLYQAHTCPVLQQRAVFLSGRQNDSLADFLHEHEGLTGPQKVGTSLQYVLSYVRGSRRPSMATPQRTGKRSAQLLMRCTLTQRPATITLGQVKRSTWTTLNAARGYFTNSQLLHRTAHDLLDNTSSLKNKLMGQWFGKYTQDPQRPGLQDGEHNASPNFPVRACTCTQKRESSAAGMACEGYKN
jgi:hypothetical protein